MEIKLLKENEVWLKGKKEGLTVDVGVEDVKKVGARIALFTAKSSISPGFDGEKLVINGAGEYEAGGVEIKGIGNGDKVIYLIVMEGIEVMVLPELKEELKDKKVERLGEADVLVFDLKTVENLGPKKIRDWAKIWGVNYLVPTGGDEATRQKFFDEMDCEGLAGVESLKLDKDGLPEGSEVVWLLKS